MNLSLGKKYLSAYCQQDWPALEAVVSSIAVKGREIGNVEINDSTIWSFCSCIARMLREEKNQTENFVLLDYEKMSIGLLNISVAKDFLSEFLQLEELVNSKINLLNGKNVNNEELSDKAEEKFDGLGLNAITARTWLQVYNSLEKKVKDEFETRLLKVDQLGDILFYQLAHIGSIIGWYAPIDMVRPYSLEDITSIIANGAEYDTIRMLRGIVEIVNSENKRVGAVVISDLLGQYNLQTQYGWYDVLLFSLVLHFVYSVFGTSEEEFRKMLIENYFYCAEMLGVSVDKALKNVLQDTLTPYSYVLANKTFCDYLKNNVEVIMDGGKNGEKQTLGLIIKKYLDFAGVDWVSTDKVNAFVRTFYISKDKEVERNSLKRTLEIFVHLKNADLIEKNEGSELSEQEKYENNLLLLLAWFGLNEVGSEYLEKYFKQEKPLVSLSSFIERIREIADVGKNETLENVISFTKLLHDNNWLPAESELVVYHEEDNQFHWNENI